MLFPAHSGKMTSYSCCYRRHAQTDYRQGGDSTRGQYPRWSFDSNGAEHEHTGSYDYHDFIQGASKTDSRKLKYRARIPIDSGTNTKMAGRIREEKDIMFLSFLTGLHSTYFSQLQPTRPRRSRDLCQPAPFRASEEVLASARTLPPLEVSDRA